jgi:DNA-binding HxlR family transcriptional regulator
MGQPKRSERGLDPLRCPVTAAMTVICPKWAAEVWKQLSYGPRRSEDLRRSIPGISRKMLTEQLREFAAQGVVARSESPAMPPTVVYALTAHGRALEEIWNAVHAWGLRHLDRRGARLPEG